MKEKIIWVIDDDMVSQFAMRYKIEQSYQNYLVKGFYSVEEALTAIKECLKMQKDLPNKLILDLVLPGLSGWDFLEELDNLQGNIDALEIYVVSAFSNAIDRKLVKKHPRVVNHFTKPLNKVSVDKMFTPI